MMSSLISPGWIPLVLHNGPSGKARNEPAARKAELKPTRTQGRLPLIFHRDDAARVYRRDKVGADIGEALGCHADRDRIDAAESILDGAIARGMAAGALPRRWATRLHHRSQIASAAVGEAGLAF
jgi:hypothetical protein